MVESTTVLLPCGLCFDECGSRCTCPCHSADLVRQCAWCPPGRPRPPKFAKVTHGLCVPCAAAVHAQLTELERRRTPAAEL